MSSLIMTFFLFFSLISISYSKNYYIPSTKTPPASRGGGILVHISSTNAFITFGGFAGKTFYGDTWAFYPNTQHWEEIIPISESSPCNIQTAPRIYYGGFSSTLNEKFYIFGGKTLLGLKNDFWEFNPKSSRWSYIETKNPPSIRQGFAYTSYIKDGNEYFAMFGGESQDGLKNDFNM